MIKEHPKFRMQEQMKSAGTSDDNESFNFYFAPLGLRRLTCAHVHDHLVQSSEIDCHLCERKFCDRPFSLLLFR
jgi:hypothetical protein